MSNYTVQTNFKAKDELPSGNAAKVIRGTDFATEFDNIASAVNTKLDATNGNVTNLTATGASSFNDNVAVNTDTLFVNASADRVGINTLLPATALDVTGVITTDGLTTSAAINVPDDTKINLGASNKLKIYYDPAVGETFQKSCIQTSNDITNILSLQSTFVKITNVDDTANYLTAVSGGGVNIFYNNNLSLLTQSYGVDITGADGASIIAKVEADDAESANLKLKNTEGEFDIRCDGGTLDIYDVTDSASRLSFDTLGNATFGDTVRSDVFSSKTATNSLIVLGNDSTTYGETGGTSILANNNLNLQAGTNDKIVLGEAGNHTDQMVVLNTANGNLGIGESAPDTRLHVKDDADNENEALLTLENSSTTVARGVRIDFKDNTSVDSYISCLGGSFTFENETGKAVTLGRINSGSYARAGLRVHNYSGSSGTATADIMTGGVKPNNIVYGKPGDIFIYVGGGSGETLWVKESGQNTNTGWVGK
jgi:hypothetical protein